MTENGTTPLGQPPDSTLTVSEALTVLAHGVQRLRLRDGVTFGGARDTYAILGYPQEISYPEYYAKYHRGGLAKTIVDAFVETTWRQPPTVREVGKPDERTATPFETTWEALVKRLKLWRVIRRLDRQARLGHFAVLVLGLRGQTHWEVQATPVRDAQDLLYVQAFSEEHCEIAALVTDDDSPLFMQPRLYDMDFSRRQGDFTRRQPLSRPALGGSYGQRVPVHASRVIHVAEGGLEDDLIGPPCLEAVWNYLLDLEKEVGGTAEMVWKDAKQRIIAEIREGAVLSEEDKDLFSERIQQFVHNLMDVLQVQNVDVRALQGTVADASNNIATKIDLVCATVRMPKRILMGSERGELASNQDAGAWLVDTIGGRQKEYGEEMILNQFVDTCIALRILPMPRDGYAWDWPPLLTETEQEQADTALAWTKTIATYAGPGGSPQEVMPLEIWLSDVLGWEAEQVERIMDLLGTQEAVQGRARPADAEDEDDDADEKALTDQRD